MANNIVEFVQQQEEFFTPVIADDKIKWEKESQFAIQAFQKNDYLAKIAMSNPASTQNAIINVAAIGITLNPAAKLAYLVPRDGGVCLDISYMGLMHLAQQTGSIRWAECNIVYSNDTFKRRGVGQAPLFETDEFGDRGEPVGAYCTVKTADGDYLTETMRKEDILAVRDRSAGWRAYKKNGKSCPWVTDELEMWRKTVVKRGSKYWPKVERLDRAIDYLNETGEGIEKEPVMRHYTLEELKEIEAKEHQELESKLDAKIQDMNQAADLVSLKVAFQDAFNMTRNNAELNQKAQAAYAEAKSKLGE